MSNKFSLKIFDLFWLGDEKDYHEDFCLHGRVQAIIGDEILDDGLNDDLDEWTVSAGAFRMLQSIYSDHYSGKEEHLLPCCGHFMFINDKMDELAILGCPNGIDWNIKHIGNDVVLKSAKGTMVTLPLEEYKGVKLGTMPRRTLHKDTKISLPWHFFLTGNALVKRSTLIEAGMFDENFTGYGHEDIELGYRIKKMGVPILYNYKAVNYHWHFVEFEEQLSKMHLAGVSTVRFYNKYKDWHIKTILGMTPFSLFFYGLFSQNGSVVKFCRKRKDSSRLCKDIILQRSYVDGIKSAMRDNG